jgi:hypothetical protein
MATRVRRVEGIIVSREERARWMGHVDAHCRTTEAWYESIDPDDLLSPVRTTDAILLRLDPLAELRCLRPTCAQVGDPRP